MTPEQLMQKRVKVIGYYPYSVYAIGEILVLGNSDTIEDYSFPVYKNDGHSIVVEEVERSPLIFQPLNWCDERNIWEMPEYFTTMYVGYEGVYKIDEWIPSQAHPGQFYSVIQRDNTGCQAWGRNCIPATKEDYDNYINSKK